MKASVSQYEEERLKEAIADIAFKTARIYTFLEHGLGQNNRAFLISHALELVGRFFFFYELLGNTACTKEDSLAVAEEVLTALVRAVGVAFAEDLDNEQVKKAQDLIFKAQAMLYFKAEKCIGLSDI